MQEDLENRTVTLIVNSSKFTGRTLYSAVKAFLRYTKNKAHEHANVKPHGKQSVKQLIGQDAGVSNTPLGENASFRLFDQIAKRYGVDYAVKKVEKDGKMQHMIFFKGRDADAIMSVMSEYASKWEERSKDKRPSIPQMIKSFFKQIAEKDKAHAQNKEIIR